MAQRIAIIGTSGAGKTTLSCELARRIGGVCIEVDALAHKANWVNATDEELRAGIDAAMAGTDRWVIDGTVRSRLGGFVTARTDLIVWLDLPLPTILLRLWRRSWRRVRTREVLWHGNIETWRDVCIGRDSVLIGAIWRHVRNRREWSQNPDRERILRLRTPAEVEHWLATCSSEATGPARTQRGNASPTLDTGGQANIALELTGKKLALFPSSSPQALCDVKDLICNRTLLGNFLNFGRSRLTIGRVCSQLLQTR